MEAINLSKVPCESHSGDYNTGRSCQTLSRDGHLEIEQPDGFCSATLRAAEAPLPSTHLGAEPSAKLQATELRATEIPIVAQSPIPSHLPVVELVAAIICGDDVQQKNVLGLGVQTGHSELHLREHLSGTERKTDHEHEAQAGTQTPTAGIVQSETVKLAFLGGDRDWYSDGGGGGGGGGGGSGGGGGGGGGGGEGDRVVAERCGER